MKILLYDSNWQQIGELMEVSSRGANVIRVNEAARFSFTIPYDSTDISHIRMASNILVAGRVPARITHRDFSSPEVTIQAIGYEDLFNHMITPKKWVYWNKGPEGYPLDGDLSTVFKDVLKRARMKKWTTEVEFNTFWQKNDVEVLSLPDHGSNGDSIVLDTEPYKSAERYKTSGDVIIRYELPENALSTGRFLRWSESVGDENRIRVRSRSAPSEVDLYTTPWGSWLEAAHSEEVEDNETIGVMISDGGPWLDIQVQLSTEDQKTADDPDEPTIYGTTPILQGLELIWREPIEIVEGDIPSSTGVLVSDTEYDRVTHLRAMVELCEEHDYSFRVRLDGSQLVLDLAESFGEDLTDSAIFRTGDNVGVEVLKEGDDSLVNVLHCWGAGSGADQLYVELRDQSSIDLYGERHGDFNNRDIEELDELIEAGQEELNESSTITTEYQVITTADVLQDIWLQDIVTVVDPQSGDVRQLPIEEIRIEEDANHGELIHLGLGGQIADLVDAIVAGRTKASGIKPVVRPLLSPALRAEGDVCRIHLSWNPITNAKDYEIQYMKDGDHQWRVLGTVGSNHFTHEGLELGERVQYRVFAQDGTRKSMASNPAAAYAKDLTPPGVPVNVSTFADGAKIVKVSWQAPADDDIAGYEIWRTEGFSPSDASGASQISFSTDTEYLDTTGESNVQYTWFVRAVDTSKNVSGFSVGSVAVVKGDTLDSLEDYNDITVPAAPTGFTLYKESRAFIFTWEANVPPPRLSHYLVEYATRENEEWGQWVDTELELTSAYFAHHELDPGKEYRYRFRAVSLAGVSSNWSSIQEAGKPLEVVDEINGSDSPTRITGQKILLDGNTHVIGDVRITPNVGEDPAKLSIDDGTEDRVVVGDISGKSWGDQSLPQGTHGIWGDQTGLYLKGYAQLVDVGYADDEDLIDLSHLNLGSPQILVSPRRMLTHSPRYQNLIPEIICEAQEEAFGKYRIIAKSKASGTLAPLSTAITSGDFEDGYWQQPQTPDSGKYGLITNFFKCRWSISWSGFGGADEEADVFQYITNEFDTNGQPINWQLVNSQRASMGNTSYVENWDLTLPLDQWAIQVWWEQASISASGSWYFSLNSAGYKTDVYLSIDDTDIEYRDPSGMSVMYQVLDRG